MSEHPVGHRRKVAEMRNGELFENNPRDDKGTPASALSGNADDVNIEDDVRIELASIRPQHSASDFDRLAYSHRRKNK
jgi:hypothetical protein